MTVRDLVKEAQTAMLGDLSPVQAREWLVKVTALLGNCNDELRQADLAYNLVLKGCYEREETSNRAKIVAECSPEYARKRLAADTRALVVEMARSLKAYMRSLDEELRLTR